MKKRINRDRTGSSQHPLRDQILFLLDSASEPMSPVEISRQLEMTLTNVAYHVRVLLDHGCLKLSRTRQVRGSTEHFYALQPGVVLERDGDASALDQICHMLPGKRQRDGVLNDIAMVLRESGRNPDERKIAA